MFLRSTTIRICLILLSLFSILPVYSESAAEIKKKVVFFRDAVYLQEESDRVLYDRYQDLNREIESAGIPKADLLFFSAETEYYMGRAFQSFDDIDTVINHYKDTREGKFFSLKKYYSKRKETLRHYEKSRAFLDEYLKISEDSRGNRLYGEVLGQMILLNNFGFLLKNGPQIPKYTERALELDPENIKARIMEAGEKIYSPRLFGGNPQRGIDMFLALLDGRGGNDAGTYGRSESSNDHSPDREDLFNIYSGIGYAYTALENNDDALLWFKKALRVYPGNVFARGMIEIVR